MKLSESFFLLLFSVVFLTGCGEQHDHLPVAAQHPTFKDWHGKLRNDNYRYLFDSAHPDTKAYINAERRYSEEFFRELDSLRHEIYSELNRHLPKSNQTVAVNLGEFLYWSEIVPGAQYPIFYRMPVGLDEKREIVLDVNQLAKSSAYYSLGDFSVSPDGNWVAFTEDRTGEQLYHLRILQIATGEELDTVDEPVGASIAWFANQALYYLPGGRQVARLAPFSGISTLLYDEKDPSFHLHLRLSSDARYVLVTARNPVSTEIRLVDKGGQQTVVSPRQVGHHYQIRLADGYVYAITNRRQPNYELSRARFGKLSDWTYYETPPGTITDFEIFGDSVVFLIEDRLISKLYVLRLPNDLLLLSSSGQAETLRLSSNPNPTSKYVKIVRSGPHFPDQNEVIELATGKSEILPLRSSQVPSPRKARREWYTSRDGTRVPITWLTTPDTLDPAPVLITVYGAYGVPQNQGYQPQLGPLLKQGLAIVQIHVRGGGELGPTWHEAGRHHQKVNSINDFIDGVDYLLGSGRIDSEQVFVRGVSAGAVIVAAAVNKRPELFAGVVLRAAYLDLIGSLADSTERLTPSDRMEWGDPANQQDFDYLASYSPYEQIRSQVYPPVLLTASTHDTRVSMNESLRWLAKLRAHDTGASVKLLHLVDSGGHFGPSDQYEMRKQDSLEYAFILSR